MNTLARSIVFLPSIFLAAQAAVLPLASTQTISATIPVQSSVQAKPVSNQFLGFAFEGATYATYFGMYAVNSKVDLNRR